MIMMIVIVTIIVVVIIIIMIIIIIVYQKTLSLLEATTGLHPRACCKPPAYNATGGPNRRPSNAGLYVFIKF